MRSIMHPRAQFSIYSCICNFVHLCIHVFVPSSLHSCLRSLFVPPSINRRTAFPNATMTAMFEPIWRTIRPEQPCGALWRHLGRPERPRRAPWRHPSRLERPFRALWRHARKAISSALAAPGQPFRAPWRHRGRPEQFSSVQV